MHCDWCGNKTNLCCERCKSIAYCDVHCQCSDWPYHRKPGVCCGHVGVGLDQITKTCSAHRGRNKIFSNPRNISLLFGPESRIMWKRMKTIGCGGYGSVEEYLIFQGPRASAAEKMPKKASTEFRELGGLVEEPLVVKFVDIEENDGAVTRSCLSEQHISMVSHPNIVTMCGVGFAKYPGSTTDDCDLKTGTKCFVMAMDKAPIDLHALSKEDISKNDFGMIAYQLIRGLAALHGKGIIHCDIKPTNVLVGDSSFFEGERDYRIKHALLADFGLSKVMFSSEGSESFGGTPGFKAPESVNNNQSTASDVFACGATIYELATRESLFGRYKLSGSSSESKDSSEESGSEILKAERTAAVYGAIKERTDEWDDLCDYIDSQLADYYPVGLSDLIISMLDPDQTKRPTAAQLLDAKYFNEELVVEKDDPIRAPIRPNDRKPHTIKSYVDRYLPHGGPMVDAPKLTAGGRYTSVDVDRVYPDPSQVISMMKAAQIRIHDYSTCLAEGTCTADCRSLRDAACNFVVGYGSRDERLTDYKERATEDSIRLQLIFAAINYIDSWTKHSKQNADFDSTQLAKAAYYAARVYCGPGSISKTLHSFKAVFDIRDMDAEASNINAFLKDIGFEVWRPTPFDFLRWNLYEAGGNGYTINKRVQECQFMLLFIMTRSTLCAGLLPEKACDMARVVSMGPRSFNRRGAMTEADFDLYNKIAAEFLSKGEKETSLMTLHASLRLGRLQHLVDVCNELKSKVKGMDQ
jgi:serine/threonine protein kinase